MGHLVEGDLSLGDTALVVGRRSVAPTPQRHRACFDHRKFGEVNVLRVNYTDSLTSLFEWDREYGTRPFLGSILVAADPDVVETETPPRDDVVSLVSNRDLSALGSAITRTVERVSENNGRPIHVCFAWVDAMLSVAGGEHTFQFLRLLLEMLDETDACGGHFHVDPENVTEEQLLTVEQLFDVVTDVDGRHRRARPDPGAFLKHRQA